MKFAGLIPNNTSPTTFQAETVLTICEGQSAYGARCVPGAALSANCVQELTEKLPQSAGGPRPSFIYLYISATLRGIMLSHCFHGRSDFWRGTERIPLVFRAMRPIPVSFIQLLMFS